MSSTTRSSTRTSASGRTKTKPARTSVASLTSRKRKPKQKPSREPFGKLPISVVTREGKTTIRQLEGRRFVRFGELRGKTLAWVELFTGGGLEHSITVRFQDQTGLHLEITPMFTLKPEYFSDKTGERRSLKTWPEIRSERSS